MAGQLQGRIDCRHNAGTNVLNFQEAFRNLWAKFNASARHTIIARYNGDVGGNIPAGGGRGTDYHDGANPMGRNAFFVVRFNNAATPYEVLFQFQDGSSETVNGGGTFNGSVGASNQAGLGVAMAYGQTSGLVWGTAWAGSTNNNGADTKSGAWWTAPVSGRVYAFPRANSRGGGYATNKNNLAAMLQATQSTNTPGRCHILFDDDNWVFAYDTGDDGGYSVSAGGVYVPRTDLTVDAPLVLLVDNNGNSDGYRFRIDGAGNTYGQTTTGAVNQNGGVRASDSLVGAGGAGVGIDVHTAIVDTLAFSHRDTNQQPNKAFATPALDEFPIFLSVEETPSAYGFVGAWNWIRHVYKANNLDHKSDKSRAMFGAANTNNKFSLPWDGSTTPGTFAVRTGVSFLWRPKSRPRRV